MRCFPILNDAIFSRCLKKELTSMFLTMFEEIQNIMLTMHINNVFQTIKTIPKNFIHFFQIQITCLTFKIWIVYLRRKKKLHRLHFNWITRLLPLLSTEFPKPKTSWKTSRSLHNDAKFWRCFWKKHRRQCFWRCSPKCKTSGKRYILRC